MKGTKYTAREKEKALKLWLDEGRDYYWVAKKTKCTVQSLYRWRRQYDGTLASLENKSSRPHSPHPNAHTEAEAANIAAVFADRPDIGYAEALGVLRTEYGYTRTYGGFYRFLMKHKLRPAQEYNEYIPQPYDTPQMLGVKWQMDVKYVPFECGRGIYRTERCYQYTMIDEATRERFLYPYKEKADTRPLILSSGQSSPSVICPIRYKRTTAQNLQTRKARATAKYILSINC